MRRRTPRLAQHAVDAHADAVEALVGLEVDVRCASVDGVEQHLVDVLDHRRFFDRIGGRAGVRELDGRRRLGLDRCQQGVAAAGGAAGNRFLELVGGHQHGFRLQPRTEPDLVDGAEIRWIGNGDEQLLAALRKRQGAVAAGLFLVREPVGDVRGFECRQIEQRQSELRRGGEERLVPGSDGLGVDGRVGEHGVCSAWQSRGNC